MLAGKRATRVGDQILREIAELLMRKVKDPRVQGVTLTGIRMSNDLKHARVFYSFIGEKEEGRRVQTGLDSAKGYMKREIGLRLDLKYVPEILFQHDATLETGQHMEKLFEKIRSTEEGGSDREGNE